MNIAILAGGLSPERDVSLSSGTRIANALAERGHRVCLLDVYIGVPQLPERMETLFSDRALEAYTVPALPPSLEELKQRYGHGDALIGPHVLEIAAAADRVFLALHGGMGENGQLQATLDVHGIRYTGTGYLGSALAMDKEISKRLFESVGIPTPPWTMYDAEREGVQKIEDEIGYPCVVKPMDCGSSVGVRMANDRGELETALSEAARYGRRVLVERRIVGRELTVGLLFGEALPAVEIVVREGFYDYENKYKGTTEEICPAPIPEEIAARAAELSKRGFSVLQLKGYARFDYMLDEAGELWCLEANTLPGMTPTSLLPQMAAEIGLDYDSLCERLVQLAL